MRGQSTEQLLSYTNRIGLWQAWSVASTAHHIKANASLARYEAERARRDDELPFGVNNACQVRKLAHHLHSSTQIIKTALSSAQVRTHNSAQSIRTEREGRKLLNDESDIWIVRSSVFIGPRSFVMTISSISPPSTVPNTRGWRFSS